MTDRETLTPQDFYFAGWYGGMEEGYYDPNCNFGFALKTQFDTEGSWADGALEELLVDDIPGLSNSCDCVYECYKNPDEVRQACLDAGFIENPQVILVWDKKARVVGAESTPPGHEPMRGNPWFLPEDTIPSVK